MNESSAVYVKSIHIYPVKSLSGIEVASANTTPEGFEWDRRWMLVDVKGQFLTQREYPKLALFECQINSTELIVSFESDSISIPLGQNLSALKNVKVWDSSLKAALEEKAIGQWFSKRLGGEVHLVRMLERHKRKRLISKPPFKFDVSFADGYPYLILSEGSLNLLNSKLDVPVDIDRFRANIIVGGCAAHDEDQWKRFSVGGAQFSNIKPCARCVIVTIDQSTTLKSAEPLKTLATYRKKANKVLFGVNAIARENGMVSRGDNIIQV